MSSKTAIVNIKPFRHLIMSQEGKRKTTVRVFFKENVRYAV